MTVQFPLFEEDIQNRSSIKFLDRRNENFIQKDQKVLYPAEDILELIANQMGYRKLLTSSEQRRGIIFSLVSIIFSLILIEGILLIFRMGSPRQNFIVNLFSQEYLFFTVLLCFVIIFICYLIRLFVFFRQSHYIRVIATYEDLVQSGLSISGKIDNIKYTEHMTTEILYSFSPGNRDISLSRKQVIRGHYKNLHRQDRVCVLYNDKISIIL